VDLCCALCRCMVCALSNLPLRSPNV
jgi:hypothetical protein